jgi:ProP effector
MNTEAGPKRPSAPHPLLEQLRQTFAVIRECQPLAIGIHKAIIERIADIDKAQLKSVMKAHTASTRYLKSLSQGSSRFDLDGNAAGEISAEQRDQATAALKERFRKGAERKRAEQQEKERLAQEQERQQRLVQLAEKFKRK